MPLLVPCDELEPGMRLCEPILCNKRVMLPAGWTLKAPDISTLKKRFPGLNVQIGDPIMDDMIDFEDDSHDRSVAMKVQNDVSQSLSQVEERFSGRSSLKGVNVDAIHSSVHELMDFLRNNPTNAALVSRSLDDQSYLGNHSGNVFYLSMLLASAAQQYIATERQRQATSRSLGLDLAMDLAPLGLGAMCMDLGMLPLKHLFGKKQGLSKADQKALIEHPNVGADLLPENTSAVARMVVRTHHENYDGSGYPQRMPGEKVHVFSRIVRIADAYDAATAEKVYAQAKSPARVVYEMSTGPYQRFYDRELVKVFVRLIQPFPIGSKLQLAGGLFGVVVRYNRDVPFEPWVVVAFGQDGKRLPDTRLEGPVRVNTRPDLRLKSFRGEDLSFVYEASLELGAPPNPKAVNDLFEVAYP